MKRSAEQKRREQASLLVEPYKDALRDLIRDLEMRSNLKTGSDKGVVDCGHGVYMRAKKVLGETK